MPIAIFWSPHCAFALYANLKPGLIHTPYCIIDMGNKTFFQNIFSFFLIDSIGIISFWDFKIKEFYVKKLVTKSWSSFNRLSL